MEPPALVRQAESATAGPCVPAARCAGQYHHWFAAIPGASSLVDTLRAAALSRDMRPRLENVFGGLDVQEPAQPL